MNLYICVIKNKNMLKVQDWLEEKEYAELTAGAKFEIIEQDENDITKIKRLKDSVYFSQHSVCFCEGKTVAIIDISPNLKDILVSFTSIKGFKLVDADLLEKW